MTRVATQGKMISSYLQGPPMDVTTALVVVGGLREKMWDLKAPFFSA